RPVHGALAAPRGVLATSLASPGDPGVDDLAVDHLVELVDDRAIRARPAVDVVAFAVDGVDRVGARTAPEPVGAAAARDDVVARPAEDPVGPGPAAERVVSAEADDHVVEPSAREILAAGRADDAAAPAMRRRCSDRLGGLRADDELAIGVRRGHREAQRVADV